MKRPSIKYRKRGVPRTKLQVYIADSYFDLVENDARGRGISMGRMIEKMIRAWHFPTGIRGPVVEPTLEKEEEPTK